MKLSIHISLTFILLYSISCTKKQDFAKSNTIQAAVHRLIFDNTNSLKNLEYLIEENGRRQRDVQMLNTLKSIVLHSPSNVLDNESHNSNSKEIFLNYTEHLISEANGQDWEKKERIETVIDRIQSCKMVFIESDDSLDYDFLRYNVYLLQKAFIDEASIKVGAKFFDFEILNMFYYSDTLKQGEEFKASINIGEPMNPDYYKVGESIIELNSENGEIKDYSLENIASDSWVFRFTPNQKGKYIFKFTVLVHGLLVKENPAYPFYVEKEFYVE